MRNSIEEFWSMLTQETDCSQTVPENRFEITEHIPYPYMSCIDQPYLFDHEFFGIQKAEADVVDPQGLQALEISYLALLDASIEPDTLYNSATDVYLGVEATNLCHYNSVYSSTAGALSCMSGRISFVLGLKGDLFQSTQHAHRHLYVSIWE